MNSLQVSPISGFKPAPAPAAPAGGASSASATKASKDEAPTVFNPNGQTTEQQIASAVREQVVRRAGRGQQLGEWNHRARGSN